MTVPDNPMVVQAHTLTGVPGDAGVKIAAAITMLPQGIGGLVDATGFTNPQTLTGFTIPPGVTVQLSPVLYTLPAFSPSIVVNEGGRLLGGGSNNPGATKLKASPDFHKPLVQCVARGGPSGYWHGGLVQDLWLDGSHATAHALEVYSLAERSVVQRLNISAALQAGLYITGSQSGTGALAHITVNGCGVYGLQLDEVRSGLMLQGVGGDNNPVTVGITHPRLGGGTLLFLDLKSETPRGFGEPTVLVTGGTSPVNLTFVGGNWLQEQGAQKTGIRITADVAAGVQVQVMGLGTSGVTTFIDDQRARLRVPIPAVTGFGLFAYNAGVQLSTNGFVAVPY